MALSTASLVELAEEMYAKYQKGVSLAELGKEYGTYANTIRRIFIKKKYELRTASQAQKNALKRGRKEHPTKGKKRSAEVKAKIGRSVSESCDRELRSKLSKENWEKQSDKFKQDLLEKAHVGMRQAAETGSKLELMLMSKLEADGYDPTWHHDLSSIHPNMHIDITCEPKIAIEVDGPSHFEPIWGEERLAKTKQSDNLKDGALIAAGYTVIRIKAERRTTTEAYGEKIYERLIPLLKLQDNKVHYLELEDEPRR